MNIGILHVYGAQCCTKSILIIKKFVSLSKKPTKITAISLISSVLKIERIPKIDNRKTCSVQ